MNIVTSLAMRAILIILPLLSLLACGGGGGSSSQDDPIPGQVETDTALKTERVDQVAIDRDNDGIIEEVDIYLYDNEGQLSIVETRDASSNIVQKTSSYTTKDGRIESIVFSDLISRVVAKTVFSWNDNNTVAHYQLTVDDAVGGLISMTTAIPAYEDNQMLGWVTDEILMANDTQLDHSVMIRGGENGFPVEANETINSNNAETIYKDYSYQWGPESNTDAIGVTSFGDQSGNYTYIWDYTDQFELHHSSFKDGVAIAPPTISLADQQNRITEVTRGQTVEKYTWESGKCNNHLLWLPSAIVPRLRMNLSIPTQNTLGYTVSNHCVSL